MDPKARILVVDDDRSSRVALAELLTGEGYAVEIAADGFKALAALDTFAPDLVLTDLMMPGIDGVELTRRVRADDHERVVVVMTAHGSVDSALAATRQGAFDYVSKPINFDDLLLTLGNALERRRLRAEAGVLRQRLHGERGLDNMIGSSPAMRTLGELVRQIAPSRASVLIAGESGTGKELVASAIHHLSPRADGPLVKLHCAALAETLLESEFFGHERGAFTGADARRDGRFQKADGGSLFLDEIGEISPATQVKLLRFLQEHEFERVGGNQTIKVDVRVIAATNRDLKQMVKDGKFREDLFYRLNVVALEVAPLRERPSDVPLLASHFLRKYAQENGKQLTGFSDEALVQLARYAWPGNVRELENAVERAVVVARGEVVEPGDLPPATRVVGNIGEGVPSVPGARLDEIERYAILKTVESTGGSKKRAAEILGISLRKVQYALKHYGGVSPDDADDEDSLPER